MTKKAFTCESSEHSGGQDGQGGSENTLRLYCARYLLPIARPPIEGGALLVREGRIAAVGRRNEIDPPPGAEVVDFGEAVLLPPLVNAHTHLELTHYPRWADAAGEKQAPSSFVDWILQVIRVKRRVDPGEFAPSVRSGLDELLHSGTGAAGDILSWFPARHAYRDTPLRGRIFLETLGRDPVRNRTLLQNVLGIAGEKRIGSLQLGLAPHSPYSVSGEYLEEIFHAARRHGLPVTTHLGESPEEALFLQDASGDLAEKLFPVVGWGDMIPPPPRRSPVGFLEDRGGLGPWNLLVHGVQARGADFDRLRRSGAAVVLCPRSNARLGVGRAPVADYLAHHIPLALGTDSRASCDSLSLWDEIAFAREVFGLPPARLLDMATAGGARALGLQGEMGELVPGAGAHFQVLQPDQSPVLPEIEELLSSPGRTAEVRRLFLDGRDVLQKR